MEATYQLSSGRLFVELLDTRPLIDHGWLTTATLMKDLRRPKETNVSSGRGQKHH